MGTQYKVSVHGQGYVGLPLAVLFALKDVKISAVTKDEKALEQITAGKSIIYETDPNYLLEQGAKISEEFCYIDGVNLFEYENRLFCPMCLRVYAKRNGAVFIKKDSVDLRGKLKTLEDYLKEALASGNYEIGTDNIEATSKTDVHVITVPTFANDYSIVLNVGREIAKGLTKDGDIIINKSTVPIGATDELEEVMKTETDKKFYVCHMQERIAEGRAIKDFREIPRTVGSYYPEARKVAKELFEILGAPVYEFDDPKITEASKIFENSFRDCNIAIANDYALLCEKKGLNVHDVIRAANTHIKTNIYAPGMVGGHCLPEDTYYVAEPLKELGEKNVIMSGRKLNEYIPLHAVELLKKGLGEDITGKRITLFGVAFKGNTDDTRMTGAKFIAEELKKNGAELFVYDPWVPEELQKEFGAPIGLEEAINTDAIIIAADHTEFYSVDYTLGSYKVLVDMRNIVDGAEKISKSGKEVFLFGVGKK